MAQLANPAARIEDRTTTTHRLHDVRDHDRPAAVAGGGERQAPRRCRTSRRTSSAMPDARKFICRVSTRSGIAPRRRMYDRERHARDVARRRWAHRRTASAGRRTARPARARSAPSTMYATVACHVTSATSAPRPLTTEYWPKPQIVSQFAVMRHDRSRRRPRRSARGWRKRVITSVPTTPTARPPMLEMTVHNAPRAALCARDISDRIVQVVRRRIAAAAHRPGTPHRNRRSR